MAKVGLGMLVWNGFFLQHDPAIGGYGLGPTPPAAELALLLHCFEACTHLPEREVLGSDSHTVFDVEGVRTWCQGGLSRRPADQRTTVLARPPRRAPAAPNPATTHRGDAQVPHVGKKRVFVSYVREDAPAVDRIAAVLRAGGIDVWLDRTHLVPGTRWSREIRIAIRDGDYFVACFSPSYARRERSFMNEELLLAIDQLRLRPRDRQWFIPIMLEPCAIPDHPIGAGETLESLHYVDLSQHWEAGVAQVLRVVAPAAAGPPTPSTSLHEGTMNR